MGIPTNGIGSVVMFDGPDGVGKTAQVKLAATALEQLGFSVYATRAHGGTPIGEKLREVSLSNTPRSQLTDLYISRTIHVQLAEDLQLRKSRGDICLIDRSPASMWAYQVRASGLDPAVALPIIQQDFEMLAADLVIVYEADDAILTNRIAGRSVAQADYFESKPTAYHQAVRAGYHETVELFGTTIIKANGTAEAVHAATMKQINLLLSNHS